MDKRYCDICGHEYSYLKGKWMCPACGTYSVEAISSEEETLLQTTYATLRKGDFDGAEKGFEDIISNFPECHKAYWGLLLAKYGIKYELDSTNGKHIPTCHATSYESLLNDKNYGYALKYADEKDAKYYAGEAEKIEKIRLKWVEIASKAPKYDIFISYKDKDENGQKTTDSYESYKLYTKLKEHGWNVFYSGESLQKISGEEYEPYIFNALNTAHVMIVFGSNPEYIKSTWVKNEWSRFYKRIERGEKHPNSLVLFYKDFNPSDLGRPLSSIQGINQTELGSLKMLEKHCERIINTANATLPVIERAVYTKKSEHKKTEIAKIPTIELTSHEKKHTELKKDTVEKRQIGVYTIPKLASDGAKKLEIADTYLKSGNYDVAEKLFAEFLASNPHNGQALVGRLLVESKCKDLAQFKTTAAKDFCDWSILNDILNYSDIKTAQSILSIFADETVSALSRGDSERAREVYEQIFQYDDESVSKMREQLASFAEQIILSDRNNAEFFIDKYIFFEKSNDACIAELRRVVNNAIDLEAFDVAAKYQKELIDRGADDFDAHIAALKIKYNVKTVEQVLNCIDQAYSHQFLENELKNWDRSVATELLKQIAKYAKELTISQRYALAYRWCDVFFKYIFEGRRQAIRELLNIILKNPTQANASLYDLLLLLIGFETTELNKYILLYAEVARKNGYFELADRYYVKSNELEETEFNLFGRLKCHLHNSKGDISTVFANIEDLTNFQLVEDILLFYGTDDKVLGFLTEAINACFNKTKDKNCDFDKLTNVFEHLLTYVPATHDDSLQKFAIKYASLCKNSSKFDIAEKFYAMSINYDNKDNDAYWGLLQAKLHCKDDEQLIHQKELIGDFDEFENALDTASKAMLKYYVDVQRKQKEWIEQEEKRAIKQKKAKKIILIACIAMIVVVAIIVTTVLSVNYVNSEKQLKFANIGEGNTIWAGKYYSAEEILILPNSVNGNGIPLVEIKDSAFRGHSEIKKVVIPTSVKKIGNDAFADCENLEVVEFVDAPVAPNTMKMLVTSMSYMPLSTVNLQNMQANENSFGLESVGERAFKNCSKLVKFEFPLGIKYIGADAFNGTALKTIVLPETVEFVGSDAFTNCPNLESVIIGNRDSVPTTWASSWAEGVEEKVEYSIRVNLEYGQADVVGESEVYIVVGKAYNLPVPSRNGYTFVGWYKDDAQLTSGDGASLSVWSYSVGGTLHAVFAPNNNTLIFVANGATSGEMAPQMIHTDETAELDANMFIRDGYDFVGWAESADGEVVWNDGDDYVMGINALNAVYAIWSPRENVVMFDGNGATNGTMQQQRINTDATAVLLSNTFEKRGYEFVGWATSADGEAVYLDGATYTMGAAAEYTLYAVWSIVRYTVSYDLQGGELNGSNPVDYCVTTETFTLNNPTRTGYDFAGWSGTDLDAPSTSVAVEKDSIGNRNYAANWSLIEYDLVYNLDGGEATNLSKYSVETNTFELQNPTKEGYTFLGWQENPNDTPSTNVTIEKGSIGSRTFTAKWSINTYVLTVHTNGGSNIGPIEIVFNSHILPLPETTRAGYWLENWYMDSEFSTELDADTVMPAHDIDAYAKWIANINTLHFNANGGEGSMDDMLIKTDEKTALTANSFTRTGYTFIGWATSSVGEVKYSNSSSYTMGASAECTLYAKWEIIRYSITYNLNNGIVSDDNPYWYRVTRATFTLNNPTRAGYMFSGWSGTEIDGMSTCVTIEQGSTGDRTYTANWEANINTLHFNANGGEGSMDDMPIETDETTTLTANTFTRTGYSFVGWATSANGAKAYNNSANYTMGPNAEYTLYAKWEIITYNISYDLNHGTVSASNPNSYNVNTAMFTLNNPTRAGYTFTGWSGTEIEGKSKSVTIEQGSTGDRTYTANWEANTNTLHFNANGGEGSMDDMLIKTDEIKVLSVNTFTRRGYTFIGWATSANGTKAYNNSANYTMGPNAEYTLYAKWSIINYSLTYTLNGGTISGTNPATYNVATATFTLKNPTKIGYTFTGWSGTEIEGKSKSVTITQGSIGNRSYTANWDANQYHANLDLNGGESLGYDYVVTTYNSAYSLPTPTKPSAAFLGWYLGDTLFEDTGVWTYTSNLNLKAKWRGASQGLLYRDSDYGLEVYGIGTCRDQYIIIPEGVRSIANDAFRENKTITRVSIPETIEHIGSFAFLRCSNLGYYYDEDGNQYLGNEKNHYLVLVKICTTKSTFETLPGTKIGHNLDGVNMTDAAKGSLKELTISANIIEWSLIITDSSLQRIYIYCTMESTSMDFYNSDYLNYVYLSKGIKKFTRPVFLGCENLTEINFDGTIAEWNAIVLHERWNENSSGGVGSTTVTRDVTIHCSDGDTVVYGNMH